MASGLGLEERLDLLSPLVDECSGIIGRVEELDLRPPLSGMFHGFAAPLGRLDGLHQAHINESGPEVIAGYGTAVDRTLARVRAVFEALERYSAFMRVPQDRILKASFRELGDNGLDPSRLPKCSEVERANAKPHLRLLHPGPNDVLEWIEGYSLNRMREIFVPLSAVYLGLPDPLSAHVAFPITTGFAAEMSYECAVLAGLCEIIERDSLALWWLRQAPFPRIEPEAFGSGALLELLDGHRRSGIENTFFDLTTEHRIPVIGLIQTCAHASPHLVIMAACRPEAAAAALRVVEEAASLRFGLANASGQGDMRALHAGEPQDPFLFAQLYSNQTERFSFALDAPLSSGPTSQDIPGPEPLFEFLERLKECGPEQPEVIAVDVTPPELKDFDIVVVRAIVPELTTFTFSHSIRYLAHPRLRSVTGPLASVCGQNVSITPDPVPYA